MYTHNVVSINNFGTQPGFRFAPIDEELLLYYLKGKVLGKSLGRDTIGEVNVFKFAPWDLPYMSCSKSNDLVWFFFCPPEKKYDKGNKTNRSNIFGYWKSSGKDRTVKERASHPPRPIGTIKSLVFHKGKPPKGERTNWVMYEYRLLEDNMSDVTNSNGSYCVYKLFQKEGLGPRNGHNYGAIFYEKDLAENCSSSTSNNVEYPTNTAQCTTTITSTSSNTDNQHFNGNFLDDEVFINKGWGEILSMLND